MSTDEIDWASIHTGLCAPFPSSEVKQLPREAGSFRYVDARSVMDRLDAVVGPPYWSTVYEIPRGYEGTGAVQCTLFLHGIPKSDVGYPNSPITATNKSGRPMSEEPLKDAYSDALKRTAVHWGIARYLYADKPTQQPAQDRPASPSGPTAPTPVQSGPPPAGSDHERTQALAAMGRALSRWEEERGLDPKTTEPGSSIRAACQAKGIKAANTGELTTPEILVLAEWANDQADRVRRQQEAAPAEQRSGA